MKIIKNILYFILVQGIDKPSCKLDVFTRFLYLGIECFLIFGAYILIFGMEKIPYILQILLFGYFSINVLLHNSVVSIVADREIVKNKVLEMFYPIISVVIAGFINIFLILWYLKISNKNKV